MQACVFPKRSNGNEKTRNRSRLPGREFDIGLSLNRKRGSAKHGLAADRKGCLQLIMDGLRRIAKQGPESIDREVISRSTYSAQAYPMPENLHVYQARTRALHGPCQTTRQNRKLARFTR